MVYCLDYKYANKIAEKQYEQAFPEYPFRYLHDLREHAAQSKPKIEDYHRLFGIHVR